MSKQIMLSDDLVTELSHIRKKYSNCSYSKAIRHLLDDDRTPRSYISKRIREIRTTIAMTYPDCDEILSASVELEKSKAYLLQAISGNECKNKADYGELVQ